MYNLFESLVIDDGRGYKTDRGFGTPTNVDILQTSSLSLSEYPMFEKYAIICDNNDAKFKGTCLNNIPSCY